MLYGTGPHMQSFPKALAKHIFDTSSSQAKSYLQ